MLLSLILSILVFILTLFAVLRKPFNIGIGYYSLMGAGVAFLLGLVTIRDLYTVILIVWNPTITFVAIIIMSLAYDEIGLFDVWAMKLSRIAGGKGLKLFILILMLGSLVSALFANDGAALVMTPVVFSMLRFLKVRQETYVAFIFSIGFISDTSSMPFTISNLVNILTSQYFSISFLRYASVMVLPDLVSVLATVLILYIIFRKSIPDTVDLPEEYYASTRANGKLITTAPLVLAFLVLLYAISGIFGLPVSLIALPFSLLILFVGYRKGKLNPKKVLSVAPWQVVLFSIGMYIVVFGLAEAGIASYLESILINMGHLPQPLNIIFPGYLFAFLASSMNNLPAVMLGNLSIAGSGSHVSLVYVNVIANDIGPKFTPIGSLATLLWIHTLRRKNGVQISPAYYMKIGFMAALPVLTVTLVSLWLVLMI